MANANKRFILNFNSSTGKVLSISIPRACITKGAASVQASVAAIIENGTVLTAAAGTPTSIKSVKRITTEREQII
jgi:hypothetical protein